MATSPFWFAQLAVKKGIPANQALSMARDAGVGVRRSTFLRMVGEVRNNFAARLSALDAPLRRRPSATEIGKLPTKLKSGYLQYVDLFRLDKTTGLVDVIHRAIETPTLMSRDRAIRLLTQREEQAIDRAKVQAPSWGTLPDSTILGGVYADTLQMVQIPEIE